MKEFLKVLVIFLWIFITVVASAGAMNSSEGIYIFCGILNLIINTFLITKVCKKLSKEED